MYDPFDYSHVVFDWNGTIIDDVALAVASVNAVRVDLGFEEISLPTYRNKFRFPIRAFYADLGFDFAVNEFEVLVLSYLHHFDARVLECGLCPGVQSLITGLHANGTRIAVLSASQQDTLHRTARCNGIEGQIDILFGLEDGAASGKLMRARDLDRQFIQSPGDRVLMIGDTDHDAEVAQDRGWDFLAVSTGHQNADHLRRLNVPVCETLMDVLSQDIS
ncbi:HAD family hydrolase [Puniceibacterium sediminis]|uniref:phosphoglycolate phosphatase n=1 Tax=Puniceibacterium sediminis TaxID=1608407 RepID=A0A238ZT57_9RHOB|nr:HAD hydrolase-like protein [Puniceibacterium sediminis]SNR86607.1 phosphoglycolate phosphatase [Puniceibacterium sediminis]